MRITLIENKKKEKDIERIINEFFKKRGIKQSQRILNFLKVMI